MITDEKMRVLCLQLYVDFGEFLFKWATSKPEMEGIGDKGAAIFISGLGDGIGRFAESLATRADIGPEEMKKFFANRILGEKSVQNIGHNETCDVDPETLRWKKNAVAGDRLSVCIDCAVKLETKFLKRPRE